MERMTFLNGDDIPVVDNDSCCEEQSEHYCGPAIDRLAAYEDTGLTPEQVKDMADSAETRLLMWFESRYGFPAGQLMELIEAEQAGRLVVLPCKAGDAVFFIRPGDRRPEITETTIEKMVVKSWGIYMKLACNAMYETSCRSIGKSVFLTREEAEKALKGGARMDGE